MEMGAKLLEFKSKQKELLGTLKEMEAAGLPIVSLRDQNPEGVEVPLSEIDPFTFFSVFNRGIKELNRLEIINRLKKILQLNASLPDDFHGIPVVDLRKAWFFAFAYMRKADDIAKLWDLAEQVVRKTPDELDSKLFERCLQIKQIGPAKLTIGMFWLNPEKFLPLDSRTLSYLTKANVSVPAAKISTLSDYAKLIHAVSEKISSNFVDISYRAYRETEGVSEGKGADPVKPLSETNGSKETALKMESQIDSLNLILYGPPGTGKTYQTIRRAVEIIDGKASADDGAVKRRFDQLLDQSRISFVTFHQSYSYEDFVEGIRPVMDDEGSAGIPRYECRDGIFKKMCALSRSEGSGTGAVAEIDWEKLRVWKMSLGNTLNPEEAHIFEDCIKGGFIAHGAGRGQDFSNDKTVDDVRKTLEKEDWTNWPTTLRHNIGQVQALRNDMHEGDIVVISYGNQYFRAIGRIAGDYRFNGDYDYPQTRPIKWLRTFDEPQPKERLLRSKAFSQLTLYQLSVGDLKTDALRELLSAPGKSSPGRYVLIIDEINRGNISKILGELITLIEPDKRQGQPYALTVTLPYSQQPLSVPHNLHILGTMNTADKSIALVDVALRRRFQFEELMPDFSICTELTPEMRTVLLKMNQRIVVRKDRDHQIGHAYFMGVHTEDGFNKRFERQIIPLLQEYFYNDWEGLRYVLGEEGTTNGVFITAVDDADHKWARTRWRWSAEIGKDSILKQLAKNYSVGAVTDVQPG